MATIYKIYCSDSEITDCYVGSTEDYNTRCSDHNSRCNNEHSKEYNYKLYKFIRANGGMDNFVIEPIYECNVEDRYIEEQRWFELLKSTLNTKSPKRTRKQYRIDNRQQIREEKKQYYQNNKQKISEYKKKYNIDNKEKISEEKKQYYIDNKQELSEKRKIKIECECGSLVTKSIISRHRKSNKHQNYINSKL